MDFIAKQNFNKVINFSPTKYLTDTPTYSILQR